jgi:hypothetical protein
VPNWVSSSFDPIFPFPWAPPLLLHTFSLILMYNYYNYFEPCALNAEFQHFILRFK